MFIQLNKAATLLFWIATIVVCVIQPEGPLSWLPLIALIIAAIHVLEASIFWLFFRKHSQDPPKDSLFILIFGIFHFQPLLKRARQQQ